MQSDTPVGAPVRQEFGIRLGAYLLDGVLAYVASMIIGYFFAAVGLVSSGLVADEYETDPSVALTGLFATLAATAIASLVTYIVYYGIEIFTGQTLGKMILKLKVGSQDGLAASQNALVIRFLVKMAANIIVSVGLITFSFPLITLGGLTGLAFLVGCFFVLGEKRQAFHDMLSKTAVFKKAELLPAGSVAPSGNY